MKTIFEHYVKNFSHFSQVDLKLANLQVGYSVTAIGLNNMPLGGGTHGDLNIARKIAVAECLERSLVEMLKNQDNNDFLTKRYPTTCGFAAGFDRESTKLRAICEGYERWLWEEWIDRNGHIKEVKLDDNELTPIARVYKSEFDSIRYFQHSFICPDGPLVDTLVNFGVIIAKRGDGVFPGSRVTFGEEELWEHCFIEAWRHLTIFNHHKECEYPSIVHKRIFNFGLNGHKELVEILKGPRKKMAIPQLKMIREYKNCEKLFLWRAICEGLVGWHEGSVSRFIY